MDIFVNESIEPNPGSFVIGSIVPSPDIQVGPTVPELGSSSSNQQGRVTPDTGLSRTTVRRMNSLGAYNYELGER